MNRSTRPFPVVLSGPSGAGKTTIEARLVGDDGRLRTSVSTTTRQPRDGEVPGRDYFFVSRDIFEKMKDRELLEWAEVHGHFYGTPRRFIENALADGYDVVMNIDVQGGICVKKAFPDAAMVFILPPSFDTLERRIRGRGGDSGLDLGARLANARDEITASSAYNYIVINDDLDEAVARVKAIIDAERCRRGRYDCGFFAEYVSDATDRLKKNDSD